MYTNITICFQYILLLASLVLISFVSCDQRPAILVEIKGVYGNPKSFWDNELNLNDLGINAIFVHSGSINRDMMSRAKSEGLKVFAEFATLNGKNYVDKHPEAWAINENGEKVIDGILLQSKGDSPTIVLINDLDREDVQSIRYQYSDYHIKFIRGNFIIRQFFPSSLNTTLTS